MSVATISILDVGHGSSAVLRSSNGSLCLIDAGSGGTILEHVLSEDVTRVDSILISHADRDHVGGLIGLLSSREFSVGSVWLNSDAFKRSRLWRDLTYELDKWESEDRHVNLGVKKGDHLIAEPFQIDVLAPRTRIITRGVGGYDHLDRRLEANTLSVVARVRLGQRPIALFPGDLDAVGLDHLLDEPDTPSLRAPVLVFPHHGGHVSRSGRETDNIAFARKLLELVQPCTVVFSTGRNEHGTPRPEIIRAVRSIVRDVRIACTQLSTRCAAQLPEYGATHLNSVTARGRSVNSCCSGSVVLTIEDGSLIVSPERRAHQDFISLQAPSALCS